MGLGRLLSGYYRSQGLWDFCSQCCCSVPMAPVLPNCVLSFHRASWVFLVCLATPDARVPR